MADIHGSPGAAPQMPAAPNAGPAPVPYQGADPSPEPPLYHVPDADFSIHPGPEVMGGVTGAMGVHESPMAHDIAAGTVAPYYPGAISPVHVHGDADAGGRDDVSATVGGAVANAEARFAEHQSDTYGQGSTIGDLMTILPNSLDPAVGVQGAEGAYYDPPRNY